MRRTISLLACALLLAVLLAGCGVSATESAPEPPAEGQETGVTGIWTADLKLTDVLNRALAEDSRIGQYLTLDSFHVELLACFNEDGTYSMHCDRKSSYFALEDLKAELRGALTSYLEDAAGETGLNMTAEELLTQAGVTMDDLLAEMDEVILAEDLIDRLHTAGRYLYEDGKLALTDDTEKEADMSAAEAVTLEGETLTITGGGEDSRFAGLFPVVFYRGN